jgi:hypothetical protein
MICSPKPFHFHAVFCSPIFNLIRDTRVTGRPELCYFGPQFAQHKVISRLEKPHKVIYQSIVWAHSYILQDFSESCRDHRRSNSDFVSQRQCLDYLRS